MKKDFTQIPIFILLVAMLVLFSLFLISGMKRHLLWGDEAETALFAKNILRFGIPYGWDGVNIMGLYNGTVLNHKLINTTTPWAQYYFSAVSFIFFGPSTTAARLPFVIVSIIGVIVLFYLARTLTASSRVALMAVFILATSIPFILYSYQSRYYALATLASLLVLASFLHMARGSKNIVLLSIASIVFFHSHYLAFVAFFAAATVSLIFLKPAIKGLFTTILVASAIIALFTLPWFFWAKPGINQGFVLGNFNLNNGIELSLRYFSDFNQNAAFPVVFIPIYVWIASQRQAQKTMQGIKYIASTCFLFIVMLSFLSTQRVDISQRSYIRYAMNIYPLASILIAFAVDKVRQSGKIVALLVMAALTFTNIMTLQFPSRSWLIDYLHELTNSAYQSSTEAVVGYLSSRIAPGDTAFVTPDYNVEPLMFYFASKVRFINRLSPTNRRLLAENAFLPSYIYDYDKPPTWIIMFGKSQTQFNWRRLPRAITLTAYDETRLPIYQYDLTRPEIFDHRFYPVSDFAKDEAVFIYRLK